MAHQISFESLMWIGSIMGSLAFFLARKRGQNPYFWFVIGFMLGLVGIFFLFIPPKKTIKGTVKKEELPKPPHPMLSKVWYYLDESESQIGPVGSLIIQSLLKEDKLTAESYVWCEDLSEWKKIGDLENVFIIEKALVT